LLERFLRQRDEPAFGLLVRRHGPLVFGVCRSVLRHTEDAEDASQATFLMLARKAGSISRGESVGGWLFTVAYRIALRTRTRSARCTNRQRPLQDVPDERSGGDPADRMASRELGRLLASELSQIPEPFRAAFRLCHVEGKSCTEAAQHLGCPRGTLQSRVGRARERLRARLALCGWTAPERPGNGQSVTDPCAPDDGSPALQASRRRHATTIPGVRKNRPTGRKPRQETGERPPYHSP
jgi:RNA polymerase sigma factor (sigma-70 family)